MKEEAEERALVSPRSHPRHLVGNGQNKIRHHERHNLGEELNKYLLSF